MGIKDLSAKIYGSRHPLNVAKTFLVALRRQKSPHQIASDSGMKIQDVLAIFKYGKKKRENEIYERINQEDLL